MVVTASRGAQRVQEAIASTTLISRADLERAQTPDLPTLLRRVTGVELAQNGGPGTVASAFIRGAEARHTLVLIDGMPINNLNFGSAALEHLPLANVERIEVVRGNVSALYGSAALGGVIQIFTREAGEQPHAGVTLQGGARGLWQLQAGGGIRLASGTRLSASVEALDDGGFNSIRQSDRPGTHPDRDGYDRRAWSFGVTQEVGIGKIGLSLRESSGRTQYDSQFGPATQADESRYAVRGAALNGQFRLGAGVEVDAALTRSEDRLRADVTAFPFFVDSRTDAASLGLRWGFAPGQTLTAGAEHSEQRIASDTVYDRSRRDLDSLRLGWQGDFGPHQWQLNARHDRYSDFGAATTYFAGYAYRIDEHWRVQASSSSGFNAPTFNDLFFPFGGNADLDPERVRSAELGVQYTSATQQLRASWFDNRFRDLIASDVNFVRQNIARARNRGIELNYRGQFGDTALRAGFTRQDPVDSNTGQRLIRRAGTLASLGVTQDCGAWNLGADLRYSGARADGARRLGAYAVTDLTASYAIDKNLKLFGRVENLFDKDYQTIFGYNQPGRSVFAGLSWQLR